MKDKILKYAIIIAFIGFIISLIIIFNQKPDIHFSYDVTDDEMLYYQLPDQNIYFINIANLEITYHDNTKDLNEWLDEDNNFLFNLINELHLKDKLENETYFQYSKDNLLITNELSLGGKDIYITTDFDPTADELKVKIAPHTVENIEPITIYDDAYGILYFIAHQKPNFKEINCDGIADYNLLINEDIFGIEVYDKNLHITNDNKELVLNATDSDTLLNIIYKYLPLKEELPLKTQVQASIIDPEKDTQTQYKVFIKNKKLYAQSLNSKDKDSKSETLIFDTEEVQGIIIHQFNDVNKLLILTVAGNIYLSDIDCLQAFNYDINFTKLDVQNIKELQLQSRSKNAPHKDLYGLNNEGKEILINEAK